MKSVDFKSQYQEKEPIVFKNIIQSHSICWDNINEILARCDANSNEFRVSFSDGNVPKNKYIDTFFNVGVLHNKLNKKAIYDYLQKGATIVANNIFDEPVFNDFAREIAQYTNRQTLTSTYIAFGDKDSYRAHWDTRDVFALQIIGRKRWVIYKPSFNEPLYFHQSKDFEDLYPCPDEVYMDVILEPGDILYIPRGWWHNPSPLGEPTVHLAIGTFPAFNLDYLKWTFKHASLFNGARAALDNDFNIDKEQVELLVKSIHEFMSNEINYKNFMEDFYGEQRMESKFNIDILGNYQYKRVPHDFFVQLNSFRDDFSSDYILTSTGKIYIDKKFSALKELLFDKTKKTKVKDLIDLYPIELIEEIENLIYELAINDVIEISK
ncbi:JmjC domain-containing protein [Acinetobacter pittii]|uniref:JmjC domain-containing protein n=2 Tax=Acinetobacter calcoaceticus/baumannii complex TaxID=909768 RepID=UPI003979701B